MSKWHKHEFKVDDEFEEEDEYEEDELDVPEGCRACGGDYPNCTTSCPLFDD